MSSVVTVGKNRKLMLPDIMLGLMFLLTCCQNISLVSFPGFSFKLSHLFFIPYALYSLSLASERFRLTPLSLNILFCAAALSTILGAFQFGVSSVALNYAYLFLLTVLTYNIILSIGIERSLAVLRLMSLAMLIAIGLKLVVYADVIAAFWQKPNGHPVIPFFFGGGSNLEATWMALFGVFFLRNKLAVPYVAGSACIAALYASRAGLITVALVALYLIWASLHERRSFAVGASLAAVAIVGVAIAGISLFGGGSYLLSRFSSIGSEPGSLGRLAMWDYAFEAFEQEPLLGYGAGNTMDALEFVSGRSFLEGNIHNYYLQVILDFGIPTFLLFVFIVALFIRKSVAHLARNPFSAFLIVYLIVAFVQFRGGDALLGFALAGIIAYPRLNDTMASDELKEVCRVVVR